VNEVGIDVKFLYESFAWDLLGNNANKTHFVDRRTQTMQTKHTLWTAEHNNTIIVLSTVMYNKTHQLNILQKYSSSFEFNISLWFLCRAITKMSFSHKSFPKKISLIAENAIKE
jgi:hypothetical protein